MYGSVIAACLGHSNKRSVSCPAVGQNYGHSSGHKFLFWGRTITDIFFGEKIQNSIKCMWVCNRCG